MRAVVVVAAAIVLAACASAPPPVEHPTSLTSRPGVFQSGEATWYGEPQMTASGERFDPEALTAAHRTLPFGTRVRVTNQRNGRSVVVRINDRGPFGKRSHVIDLSRAAARELHMLDAGIVPVDLELQ